MGSVRLLALGCVALLLAACGGGGGGGGGSRSVGNFTIATTSVTFEGELGGPTPAPAVVTGSITGVDQTVFLTVVLTSNGLANASVSLTGETTGQLLIFPKNPAQLSSATVNDTITVSACLDAGCSRHIGGSPKTINVTYNVRGLGVGPGPGNVVLTSSEGGTPAPQLLTLTNNTGTSWTSSIAYAGPATGWLTLTPTSGAAQGAQQLTFNGSAMNVAGTYTATVQITAGTRTRNIPVSYIVFPNLTLSQASATLTAVTGQVASPAGASLNVMAVRPTPITAAVSYGPGASNWLAVTGTAAPGPIGLAAQSVALAPGSYQATVTLTPTLGTPVAIAVTYTLAASVLMFTPANPLFTIDGSSIATAPFLQRTVATGDTGASLTWTASSSVPWLNVTPAGASGQNAVLTLVPAALQTVRNGSNRVNITFTYNGPSVVNQTRNLPVELSLNLPTIEHAMPHVAYLNEQKELVLRGSGFSQPGGAAVTIDGTPPATLEVVSDTELRMTPPASVVAAPSRPLLKIANALNLERTADFVVRAKPAYGNVEFDHPDIAAPTGWRVVYDAERDLVFGARGFTFNPPDVFDTVTRFALDPTGVAAPTVTFKQYPALNDIALSADGRTLFVLTATELHFVDPSTMNDMKPPVPVPVSGSGGAGRMAVINTGRILMSHLHRFYSPQANEFELVADPVLSDGLMEVSADGSRIAMQPIINGSARLGTFDASTNEFRYESVLRASAPVSLNRNGTRIAAGGDVFNADLTPYGTAPPTSINSSRLSPAGDRLYSLQFGPVRTVGVYDTSTSVTPFPELTPIAVPFDVCAMGISLNGEHVFIVSDRKLFVIEP